MRRVLLIVTLAALIGDFVVGAVASRFSAADKDAAKSAIQNTTSVDGLRVTLPIGVKNVSRGLVALP
ncbi:MAG: hypothetical protein P8Y71_00950 [Pseudolabrys sp.]